MWPKIQATSFKWAEAADRKLHCLIRPTSPIHVNCEADMYIDSA